VSKQGGEAVEQLGVLACLGVQEGPALLADGQATNEMNATIQQQSPHNDITGLSPGLYVRTGHGDHVVAGRTDGVGDFGGDVVLHLVQDASDRYS
jgi:hypothetical protein